MRLEWVGATGVTRHRLGGVVEVVFAVVVVVAIRQSDWQMTSWLSLQLWPSIILPSAWIVAHLKK